MPAQHQTDAELNQQSTLSPPPALWRVLLLNDDFTPMDFVINVLEKFFGMNRERATQVMLKVHTEGRGMCGVFPKDIASTKVAEVSQYSRQHQQPLQCTMEVNE
ncbi:ATP-dependent Clp protease adapter ClpS [Iodobacter sp. LRB]|jgi:ATP-dependent Clp protease adaptor protein ClpS|uniref:ATP-dependent Clp protease adapter protein ClpS n=3 Tax=Iodobacter TaxID=32014 RepID=A0A377SXG2_9NEIS|nr:MULTISPECIES: ATP-dependent Clp protease adapter ClpS [Betaproteobacteria]AMC35868.1 ATP-dependent Clp protease adaptor ClpS [Janthinobacterium sp. B9-8]NHQ88335.1 ATP-dependent Clp protease adapter ClpS [Iodobacter violacea]PHV03291.1 ATP-dependent Clp protease adapter ClpS [Iodobacter sp. BJB302]TCU83293.1 ATP-dependent Clp protease adaptor protein ClpS [Iodobacter fluviatilis]STR45990.1 ATP-dependent Clp protease adapter protein ClpS [Iodobacter fluviatilis]